MLFRPFSIESHGGGGSHGAAVVHVLHTDRTSFSYIFSERLRQPLTVLELAGLLVLFFTPFFVFFCPCACLVGLATCSEAMAATKRLYRCVEAFGSRRRSPFAAARSKEPSTSHVPVARRAQCFPSAAWASNALDTRAEGLSFHPKN